jgi:dTDP-4-amino-4,6-dideoxygalactose transaminase
MRKIPLGRPYLNTENILDEVKQVLDTKWISGGPTIAKFEDAIQSYNGGGYPVAVANGTIAIDMALLYLNDGKRYSEWDEVIVPSWSWVATGFSPINVGASPVWCDVNSYGVPDVESIEPLITENTKAIIIVHQMGVPCDMDAINALSIKYRIPVIEDAACGFGSEYKGVKIGNSRNLVTYSLQARKCLTTGEGGFVIARDEKEAEWFKSYRAFGTSVSPLERDKASFLLKEQFTMLGSNHKISDITAAVGLAQLKTFDEEVILRDQAGKIYNKLVESKLSEYASIGNVIPDYCTRYNWQNYHIILKSGFNRDNIVDALRKKGIGSKWDIQCIHLEPLFRNKYNHQDLWYSLRFHNNGLWLPFFAEITLDDQEYVINTLKEILDGFEGIDTIA